MKLIVIGASLALLGGCAGPWVPYQAADGSDRGGCRAGIFAVPTACFLRPASGEVVVTGANGAEDFGTATAGAGILTGGVSTAVLAGRYRPDNISTSAAGGTATGGSSLASGGAGGAGGAGGTAYAAGGAGGAANALGGSSVSSATGGSVRSTINNTNTNTNLNTAVASSTAISHSRGEGEGHGLR